jgi:hypothetical protein
MEIVKQKDEPYWKQNNKRVAEEWVNFIRKGSPIGVHHTNPLSDYGGAGNNIGSSIPEVASIRKALNELEKETGLVGRDMHEKNVMIRGFTNEIVVVDLGLFKLRSEINKSKVVKENKRIIIVEIKKMSKEELEEKKKRKKKKKVKKKKGKKDACYHKVRSRYDVWPSAYASGALVKCRKVGAANWGNKSKKNESLNEEFKPHVMYDPKTGKSEKTKVEADHHRLAKKGYTHVNPKDIEKVLKDEGGASGMDPFLKEIGKDMEEEIIKTLEAMPNVGQHKDKDYILHDDKEVHIQKESMSLKKKIRIKIIKRIEEGI